MATALALNATSTLISNAGLAANVALLTEISTFTSQTAVTKVSTIFANAMTGNANIGGNLEPLSNLANVSNAILSNLKSLGSGVTNAQWLLDICPSDTLIYLTSTPGVYGNLASGNYKARLSSTISTQAQGAFADGISGFANVFMTAYGYASSVFDTVASADMLTGKTYAQSGIGYTGPADLATGGVGNSAALLGNTVSKWGTMYDIKNITKIGDPYVFGQNILNQGLGNYGNLSAQLTSVGLDITDLPTIPKSTSTTTQESTATSTSSFVGAIEIPGLENVTTTTVVTGSSPAVVKNIYANVTAGNLTSIVSATNFTGNTAQLVTLDDYLNFNKVVDSDLLPALANIGITDFPTFGQYVHNKVGQGNYKSWKDLSDFLLTIEFPVLGAPPGNTALYATSASTIKSTMGTGTGPFNNLTMPDYFNIIGSDKYYKNFKLLNDSYNSVVTSQVINALTGLDASITKYLDEFDTADIAWIASNVANVNTQLNAITVTTTVANCQTAYTSLIANVQTEINNLKSAGAMFGPGTPTGLLSFAQNFPITASDRNELLSYQVFANIITPDSAGDTLRAAVTEVVNTKTMATKGIALNNDPDPRGALAESARQGIPLTTYLSQNK